MTVFNAQSGSMIAVADRIAAAATPTTVYTVQQAAKPMLEAISLCNVSGGTVLVSVHWYRDSDATSYAILFAHSLAANTRLQINDLPITLRVGDEIRVTSSVSSGIDVILTIIESLGGIR